jgi:hypothetical protein
MKPFKFNQYIQYKNPQEGSWGFFVHSYEYVDGHLYLYSGDNNLKHDIDDVIDRHKSFIIKVINDLEE